MEVLNDLDEVKIHHVHKRKETVFSLITFTSVYGVNLKLGVTDI